MSKAAILKTINHYKKSIEKTDVDEKRLLHCIAELYKLPVSVTDLQETGIGRTVNGLCRDGERGEVRVAAKSLIMKWKTLVANESSAESSNENQLKPVDDKQHRKDGDRIRKERQDRSHSHHKSHQNHTSSSRNNHQNDNKETGHHSDSKEIRPPSTKHDLNGEGKSETRVSSSSKESKHSGNNSEDKSHHHRKSKEHSSSSHHHQSHKSSKRSHHEKKRSREKVPDEEKIEEKREEKRRKEVVVREVREKSEEIDCTAGTSFADALAMMDAPPSSSKSKTVSTLQNQAQKKSVLEQPATSKPAKSTSLAVVSGPLHTSHSKASRSSTYRPEKPKKADQLNLLASTAKLEPLLDPEVIKNDILSAPVVINTSYTPAPCFNPTNTAQVSAAISKNKRQMAVPVFEAFEIPSHSKTRTKVYSGNKSAQAVTSLYEMCIKILQKNVDALEYTGGVPYDILKPVLEKCSPQQLHNFEYYNPYLLEDTDELWQQHCHRQYRGKKRDEMESWRDMYIRCQTQEQERLSHLTESIKQSQSTSLPVKQTKLAYVDRNDKVPRLGVRRMRGTGGETMSLNASLANKSTVSGTRLGHLTAGRDVGARRAPLMQKTLMFMKQGRR